MNGFIVLSHPRSGTSYLVHGVLSAHPKIRSFGEVFNSTEHTKKILRELDLEEYDHQFYLNSKRFKQPNEFLRDFRKKVDSKFMIGFKIFPEQLFDYNIIRLTKNWPIIFLRRKNIAQSAISYEIARRTGQWNKTQAKDVEPFDANIPRMVEFIKRYTYYLDNYEKHLADTGTEYLSLEYENLFTREALDDITTFLKLEPYSDKFQFKDTKLNNSDRYRKLILNVEEVDNVMKGEGYGSLLDS